MRIIYWIIGFIFFGLCVLGMVFPFLPSTPFVLIAAFCFAKSSKRLDAWFKSTKLYKNNIESLIKKEGLTNPAKIRIMTTLTIVFVIAAYFARTSCVGLICLAIVWACHIIGFCFFVKKKSDITELK